MPIYWTSKVSQLYKRNAINGDLNQSYQTSINFDREKQTIREKYRLEGYHSRFADNVIRQFHEKLIII